uniref:E3 ubiquitin-protein ligase RNF123/RKP TPR repeat domain-containing protein n=1 Tax=Solanum lycopersicum TaxID=4081 RepID=A0A3Q7GLA2_SOLLC
MVSVVDLYLRLFRVFHPSYKIQSLQHLQVLEFQQRKCSVIFDLSCNLARILEFCTHEIPQAFISGADTNLQRLTEVIVFILNHLISAADQELFESRKVPQVYACDEARHCSP